MAHKHEIPVYVLADSLKIGPVEADPEKQRCNSWLPTDVEKEKIVFKNAVHIYNPRGDRVPPDLITAIITEKGFSDPKNIRHHITYNILIHTSLKQEREINIGDCIGMLGNIYIDDMNSKTEILNREGNIMLYRKTISIGINKNCSVEQHSDKKNFIYKIIKIDYFLDEMNANLYVLNISSDLDEEEAVSKNQWDKISRSFSDNDEFELFNRTSQE